MLYAVGSYVDLSVKKKDEPEEKTGSYIPGTKIIFADLVPDLRVLKITPNLLVFNRTSSA